MIESMKVQDAMALGAQLKVLLDQESRYQPKLCGLRVLEAAHDNGLRMTARLREFEAKDLLFLTRFFGFTSETFSLAVNLLDRFLSLVKIQPKHLSCVGLCCFYIAVKALEEERNVPLASDLIRISQNRFTVSDMMRMEKIILEKLCWKVKATTALHFLRLYSSYISELLDSEEKKVLNLERLEAQLKACHCSFTFSKIKPSLLALAILALEVQEQGLQSVTEGLLNLQQHSSVKDGDLACMVQLVAKCLIEYSSTKRLKPSSQKMRWIISGRTARQLKHSYYKIAHLPTIPEASY